MAIGRLRLKTKAYDFPPYRPPSEAYSLLLRVTRGCPWNKCTFCSMYKSVPFERRPLDDILHDVNSAAELYGTATKWVFWGDSNSLAVKTESLETVLEALRNQFPRLERVTSYARAKTIAHKDLTELQRLRDGGLVRLHVGMESGDADILALVKKRGNPRRHDRDGAQDKGGRV